jgi:hypothetical protein
VQETDGQAKQSRARNEEDPLGGGGQAAGPDGCGGVQASCARIDLSQVCVRCVRRAVAEMLADPASELHFSDDAAKQAALEDRDYYTSANVFWVPQVARWETLRAFTIETLSSSWKRSCIRVAARRLSCSLNRPMLRRGNLPRELRPSGCIVAMKRLYRVELWPSGASRGSRR